MVSIKANGASLVTQFHDLEDSLCMFIRKTRWGECLLDQYKHSAWAESERCSLLRSAEELEAELVTHSSLFSRDKTFVEHIWYCIVQYWKPGTICIVTAADEATCLSIERSLFEFHRGSFNVCSDYVPSFKPPWVKSSNLRRLHELYPDPFVLITADKNAAVEIQNLGRDVSVVIDYDVTSYAGQLSQHTSDWLKDCQEQHVYNRLQFQYTELLSRFEQLLNKQRCRPRLVASPKAIDPPTKAIDPPIKATDPLLDHYWKCLDESITRLSMKIRSGKYLLDGFASLPRHAKKAKKQVQSHALTAESISKGLLQHQKSKEWSIYKKLKGKYELLVSNLEQLLEQQLGEIGAATTIACWWRRTQLALKHRAANVIQQHMRSALCRIKTKRDQIAAAERHNAAKTIQVWRKSLVLQRKIRRLGAAALTHPLRERNQALPPRSRSAVRRQNRRMKGRRKLLKNEEGPQESFHELQQSVQSLQESVHQLEHRNQQLVDTNTLLLQELSAIRELLSNIGTNNKSVLHNPSGLSCRGNVIGNSLHNTSVSGSRRREGVSDKSHRHGGENIHTHDATITQDVIGAALPSRLSGSESVLETSRPSPISSSRGKSSRRRRRRRRRRRYKRWTWGKTRSDKSPASTSGNNHDFAIDYSKHQSTQTTAVNSKSTPSGTSRSISLDETHSISSTSISSPSTSSVMTSSPVVPSQDTTSDLEQPIPPDPNELQPLSSSTTIVDIMPSSITTLVESTPSTSNITEEEPSTCHGKPISYLSALLGTTTNIG